ncbi:MAG TPA: selenocysteine-specific translation elongation factor [Thermoanaerobacterales bacterium]|nr:selenocysteine-specific translation elongation factor [Thermoanaerobacterales bacterium]
MSNIILGTAGHIDHGKTTLIKALTGINTDRLKEEQKRGITIDLGFAYMTLPSGKTVGIVDVPGHEKFVKNMLAGAGGIDIVLLVIAADEGVMPQTREHLNILELLNVKKGIVVLTKMDLVDEEWLEMVIEEVREELMGTFLEKAQIMPVSSTTGEGLKQLVEAIDEMCRDEIIKDRESPFRLPVDRVFTLQGIGTVVTGSLLCGMVKIGDDVGIFPEGRKTRVRSIQVHGESRDKAEAGQRTALNLADVKTGDIQRGDVVAPFGTLFSVTKAYAYLKLTEDAPGTLKNRARIRLHIGTKEAMARVNFIDREELSPGEETFALLLMEEPIACVYKDYYVIRSYSPVTTIGGGQILFVNPKRIKKDCRKEALEALKKTFSGGLQDFVIALLGTFGREYLDLRDICPYTGKNIKQMREVAMALDAEGKVILIRVSGEDVLFDTAFYKNIARETLAIVQDYHKKFPLSEGIAKEELRSRINLEPGIFEALLAAWIKDGLLECRGNIIKKKGFSVVLSPLQQDIFRKIQGIFFERGWTPPAIEEVMSEFQLNQEKEVKDVLLRLIDEGKLIKINEDIYMSAEWVEKALHLLQQYFVNNRELTVSSFRDMLGTSRKYALPLLEYMDSIKATRRVKEVRVAGSNLYG